MRLADAAEPFENHLTREPRLGPLEARTRLSPSSSFLRVFSGELGLRALHLLDETIVAVRLDDLIELGPVIQHEADAFDVDVVDHPPVAVLEETVVHRHLGAVLGDDLGADGGEGAIQALAAIDNLFATVELNLGEVGALEEVLEEADEFRVLGLRQRQPVAAEGPARNLGEVEDLVGDLADCRPPLDDLPIALERGVVDRREDAVDGALELLGGGGRPDTLDGGHDAQGREREPE